MSNEKIYHFMLVCIYFSLFLYHRQVNPRAKRDDYLSYHKCNVSTPFLGAVFFYLCTVLYIWMRVVI